MSAGAELAAIMHNLGNKYAPRIDANVPDLEASLPHNEKIVLCPRCGMRCSLRPLHRPGTYRLVDPDGHGHLAVCIAAPRILATPVRYRSQRSVA